MEGTFYELIGTYGYIVLFIWCILEGETALIIGGIFAHTGTFDLPMVIIIGALGGMTGDFIYFYIGRFNRSFIYKRLTSMRRKFAIAHILIQKHGNLIVFLQRFMYGLRIVVPMSIGLTKYPISKFIIYNGLGSLVWALLFAIPAYMMGEHILEILTHAKEHWYLSIPILAIIVASLFYSFHRMEENTLQKRRIK